MNAAPACNRLGRKVVELAGQLGCSPGTLALAWLMRQPAVSTVIVGATRVVQLEENLASASLELAENTLAELDAISKPFRYAEPFAVFRLKK